MSSSGAVSDEARERVLAATEALLAERGPGALSLREAARRAGVSHAAPGYFFGDGRGLLTAVAVRSNARLTSAMEQARRRHRDDPYEALLAVGRAYVRFALDSTAEFRNLFGDGITVEDPVIEQCRLEGALPLMAALSELHPDADPTTEEFGTRMNLAWTTVHGTAVLAIDHRLIGTSTTAISRIVDQVVDALGPALAAPLNAATTESASQHKQDPLSNQPRPE